MQGADIKIFGNCRFIAFFESFLLPNLTNETLQTVTEVLKSQRKI